MVTTSDCLTLVTFRVKVEVAVPITTPLSTWVAVRVMSMLPALKGVNVATEQSNKVHCRDACGLSVHTKFVAPDSTLAPASRVTGLPTVAGEEMPSGVTVKFAFRAGVTPGVHVVAGAVRSGQGESWLVMYVGLPFNGPEPFTSHGKSRKLNVTTGPPTISVSGKINVKSGALYCPYASPLAEIVGVASGTPFGSVVLGLRYPA